MVIGMRQSASPRRFSFRMESPALEHTDGALSGWEADIPSLDCGRHQVHAPHRWTSLSLTLFFAVLLQGSESEIFPSRSRPNAGLWFVLRRPSRLRGLQRSNEPARCEYS